MKKLLSWSKEKYAKLPWRKKRSLYGTLVSEVMLQQTTVATVLSHFERFLELYPDIESLALSSEEEILRAWKGLGYYRRAKNLRKAALDILEFFGGKIPLEMEELLSIKGIGPYTAAALMAIGEDKPALALDANLERVLARYYGLATPKGPKLHAELQRLFSEGKILGEMKRLGPRALTEALMDLGREFCQARKASCEVCPLKKNCVAFKEQRPLFYPHTTAQKKEKFFSLKLLRVVVLKGEKVLAYKKEEGEWLSGQWELPTFVLDSEDKKLKQYPHYKAKISYEKLPSYKTSITKYKIQNFILVCKATDYPKKLEAHDPHKGDLSTASLKALAYLKR